MSYEYKMVQMPTTIATDKSKPNAAAEYVQKIANEHAAAGWEFFRIDSMSTAMPAGCLGGGQPQISHHHVVTFRRQRATES